MLDITDHAPEMAMPPFTQLVKIAEILANPARFFHPDHLAIAGLQSEQIEVFCKAPKIGKRLNAALAKQIGASALDLDLAVIGAAQNSDLRALVTAPYIGIEAFLRQVTAVRLQHAIRSCVLKADRARVQAILGDDAYNTALREAPFFYADIGDSSAGAYFAEHPEATKSMLSIGATITHRYIASIDAGLAQIFAWRLPKAFITDDDMDAKSWASFSRLLASKGPHTMVGRM